MARIHFLNVGDGDCTIIEHNSDRVTMIDISCGNLDSNETAVRKMVKAVVESSKGGNFNMKDYPTKPQDYLASIGKREVWRFLSSHPDMDHLDGFAALLDTMPVSNFWHIGANKPKPDFRSTNRYREEDWGRYARACAGNEPGVLSRIIRDGDRFRYANQGEHGAAGDGLTILAPVQALVDEANRTGDFNDASLVILYQTAGFKILFCGDSHDATWDHILKYHLLDVMDCDLMIAPHHGRDSGREWNFLDVTKPRVTLFGNANSEHLAYDAWNRRNLFKITNNQAGNVVIDIVDGAMHVYVENDSYAKSLDMDLSIRNTQGYAYIGALNPRQAGLAPVA